MCGITDMYYNGFQYVSVIANVGKKSRNIVTLITFPNNNQNLKLSGICYMPHRKEKTQRETIHAK